MKRVILPLAVVLTTCLYNCKCDEQKVVYPIGDDMHAYIFNDSSYWVYRNTTTSDLDTVMIYRTNHGNYKIDTNAKCVELQKEYFDMNYVSSNKPFNSYDAFFIDYEGIRLNGTGIFPYVGMQIFNRLQNIGDSTLYSKYFSFYPSLTIEGQVYSNVKKIEIHYSLITNDSFYYWSPHVGIVRKEFHANGSVEYWDLIEKSLK